jgi:CRP-like cAMP-binding protein
MTALWLRSGNAVLARLPSADRSLLEPHLEPVTLKFRQRLESSNRRIRNVYFLERGLASVVAFGRGKRREAEVAIIGRDSMTGLAVVLGAERSPHETFMQVEGEAQCISADALRGVMEQSRSVLACLLRCAHTFSVQTAHTALANARGNIEERLARWLLMAHDRLEGDDLRLTHEHLSVILGVRRAGITTALHHLESARLISTSRGSITIIDRDGLEISTNGLYGGLELERLLLDCGPSGECR